MKKEQENMEKLLKSELKKEAEEILADVEAEESLKDVSIPEEMDDVLREMIQKMESVKALEKMLPEKDQEALRLGREILALGDADDNGNDCKDENEDDSEPESVRTSGKAVVRYRRRLRKAYLLVAVVVIMVLAVGMTSIGGTPFFMKIKKQFIGDRDMVKVNTERDGEKEGIVSNNDEEEFYHKIEEEFGFVPVKIGYKPEGTTFLDYNIESKMPKGCLLYEYNDAIIEYRVLVNYKEFSYSYDIEDQLIEEYDVEVDNVPIHIKKYLIDENKNEFVAQFKYRETVYVLNGVMEKEEFEKIIENLIFL